MNNPRLALIQSQQLVTRKIRRRKTKSKAPIISLHKLVTSTLPQFKTLQVLVTSLKSQGYHQLYIQVKQRKLQGTKIHHHINIHQN